jgi:hypothetical protein
MKNQTLETLEKLTNYVVKETNRYVAEDFRIYGKTLQQIKETMGTADFTKLFQYIVNEVIEAGITTLKVEGVREEVTGYDYVIDGTPIEFKLMGGSDKSSFATGNKTSHFGGAKTNIVWSIKYEFDNNQITAFGMVVIDTDQTDSNVWKSSGGRKDSFSTLQLMKGEEDCILAQIGIVRAATKKLQFLPLPTNLALGV